MQGEVEGRGEGRIGRGGVWVKEITDFILS